MKTLIFVVASVLVVGGLLVDALAHHENAQKAATAQNTSLQQKLTQANKGITALKTQVSNDQVLLVHDEQQLCAFIGAHVKGVTLPAVCQ